jgi:hypothetical protein
VNWWPLALLILSALLLLLAAINTKSDKIALGWAGLFVAMLYFLFAGDDVRAAEIKRSLAPYCDGAEASGFTYVCRDSEGLVDDQNHNEWPAAVNSCLAKAEAQGREFALCPGMSVVLTPTTPAPPDPDPDPPPDPDPDPEEEPDCELEEGGCLIGSFDVIADGQPVAWPAEAAAAMQQEVGRLELTFKPERVTTSGQRMLDGTNFGIWLWTNEVHGDFWSADGTRQLWRDRVSAVVPGEERTVTFDWWPDGIRISVGGQTKLWMPGATLPRSELLYGAAEGRTDGFMGELAVRIYDETSDFDDPCENLEAWATVNNVPFRPPECLADVNLEWTPPTEYTDGKAIAAGELELFRIYSEQLQVLEVPAPSTQATLAARIPGKCYTVTAVARGLESDPSNEACK